jgi:hypothetical protein
MSQHRQALVNNALTVNGICGRCAPICASKGRLVNSPILYEFGNLSCDSPPFTPLACFTLCITATTFARAEISGKKIRHIQKTFTFDHFSYCVFLPLGLDTASPKTKRRSDAAGSWREWLRDCE